MTSLRPRQVLVRILALLALGAVVQPLAARESFINFETPHVHPIAVADDGNTLAVVNTADHRLELYDVANGRPAYRGSVTVGLEPVSVRFFSDGVAWVVNRLSDSLSVVDVEALRVLATVDTADEPADVVFAGAPRRAYVSCSQANEVQVFNPNNVRRAPVSIPIGAKGPRALAVSPDGRTVYAAIWESGNGTTVLSGGLDDAPENPSLLPNVVSDPAGPYGGRNPPPNRGDAFQPPIGSDLSTPPPVSLIVKRDEQGRWLDDNGGDWTRFVSGDQAFRSGRVEGWKLLDRDVAVIDTRDLSVGYIEGLMNINMALAVNPRSGKVTVVGTDAMNHVRYLANLNGVFLRVLVAVADRRTKEVRDLNPHLDYRRSRIPESERLRSIGDPRAIAWSRDGRVGYVVGKGSNNLVRIDESGRRIGEPIELKPGPTGLALHPHLERLYVVSRIDHSVTVFDTRTETKIGRAIYFNPTPSILDKGRRMFYETTLVSGLGHVSCASCHVDGRTDALAWDLGMPDGEMKTQAGQNTTLIEGDSFEPWHPMKGPMRTQPLVDIIGKEPFHWRGDQDRLEDFIPAASFLMGRAEEELPRVAAEMTYLKELLQSIHLPPNPYRNLDNSLPANLPLAGHFRTGRFGQAGARLPDGNARRGLELFRDLDRRHSDAACVECHSLPAGTGPPGAITVPGQAARLALVGDRFSAQRGFKIPQLRNLYERVGFDLERPVSRAGFGFLHDGSVDSLARLLSSEPFDVRDDQEVADLVALMLSFSGSDFGGVRSGEPAGVASRDVHAAVGRQVTISRPRQRAGLVNIMIALADSGAVDLVAKGPVDGVERGVVYRRAGAVFEIDEAASPALTRDDVTRMARPSTPWTFTVVPAGSGERIGIDRDEDGIPDFDDETLGCTRAMVTCADPFDP